MSKELSPFVDEPSIGPFVYEASAEDRLFLYRTEKLLLERGRAVSDVARISGIDSDSWIYARRRGKWLFQVLNVEGETPYTTSGSTIFSLFEAGIRRKSAHHFVLNGTVDHQQERVVTYIASRPQFPPVQLEIKAMYGEFQHDAERILADRRPHAVGDIIRHLITVSPLHAS